MNCLKYYYLRHLVFFQSRKKVTLACNPYLGTKVYHVVMAQHFQEMQISKRLVAAQKQIPPRSLSVEKLICTTKKRLHFISSFLLMSSYYVAQSLLAQSHCLAALLLEYCNYKFSKMSCHFPFLDQGERHFDAVGWSGLDQI